MMLKATVGANNETNSPCGHLFRTACMYEIIQTNTEAHTIQEHPTENRKIVKLAKNRKLFAENNITTNKNKIFNVYPEKIEQITWGHCRP